MSLSDVTVVLLGLAVLLVVVQGMRGYLKYRGVRLVSCPETQAVVATRVDAVHAALAAVNGHSLRLSACSRWPERQNCGQECLGQIERAPEACLIRTLAREWYAGKRCAYCRTPLGDGGSFDHPSALLGATGQTRLWSDVPPERLPEALRTSHAVCWNCHIIERFRRQHPELVVDGDPAARWRSQAPGRTRSSVDA